VPEIHAMRAGRRPFVAFADRGAGILALATLHSLSSGFASIAAAECVELVARGLPDRLP
jgi:hypothetical protein